VDDVTTRGTAALCVTSLIIQRKTNQTIRAGAFGGLRFCFRTAQTLIASSRGRYGALSHDLTVMLPNVSGFFLGIYYCAVFTRHRSANAVVNSLLCTT
jgi:hypothetical protein